MDKTRKLLDESKPVVLAGYFGNRNMAALLDSKLLDSRRSPWWVTRARTRGC